IGMGKAVDGFVDKSETSQKLLGDYLSGEKSFVADLKDVLSRPALSSGDVQNLTVSALLGRVMAGTSGEAQNKIGQLLEVAERLGLDDVKIEDQPE
ncbi:MAG: flotillin family protein, partial [Bosea sp.]|uniref:hypothetical protein n=1 Tax=Bosea sp. (in: a-proteobacteria) TaxID=1871050 RepID=UPI002394C7F4|nr:flotillin family protein [Bosea sp. (in: a-proteobacteria)]